MKKISPGLSVLVAAACCIILLVKCEKEYSYEEKSAFGETAMYSLSSGAGGVCLNTIVKGIYNVGLSLDSSNTIEVDLMVDSIGTYNISTNLVNGMQFSAKGSFVNAGAQTVILRGAGTPIADGTFAFQINGPNGCSTEVIVAAAAGGIFYTLVGQPNDCAGFTVNGTYTSGATLTGSNTVQVQLNVLRAGPYSISTDTLDGIYFSASGSVSAIGIQNITLAGKGTPIVPRDLVFTTRGINTSCTFSLTVQNAAPVATYVLESGTGSPIPCIFTVNGTYKKDTVLAAANTVKMNVFITTVGNYTVATQTVNGITFAATGTFTTTGAQQITLTGAGIPKATGTFTFTPKIVGPAPLGGATCSFTVDVM